MPKISNNLFNTKSISYFYIIVFTLLVFIYLNNPYINEEINLIDTQEIYKDFKPNLEIGRTAMIFTYLHTFIGKLQAFEAFKLINLIILVLSIFYIHFFISNIQNEKKLTKAYKFIFITFLFFNPSIFQTILSLRTPEILSIILLPTFYIFLEKKNFLLILLILLILAFLKEIYIFVILVTLFIYLIVNFKNLESGFYILLFFLYFLATYFFIIVFNSYDTRHTIPSISIVSSYGFYYLIEDIIKNFLRYLSSNPVIILILLIIFIDLVKNTKSKKKIDINLGLIFCLFYFFTLLSLNIFRSYLISVFFLFFLKYVIENKKYFQSFYFFLISCFFIIFSINETFYEFKKNNLRENFIKSAEDIHKRYVKNNQNKFLIFSGSNSFYEAFGYYVLIKEKYGKDILFYTYNELCDKDLKYIKNTVKNHMPKLSTKKYNEKYFLNNVDCSGKFLDEKWIFIYSEEFRSIIPKNYNLNIDSQSKNFFTINLRSSIDEKKINYFPNQSIHIHE